MATKTKKKPALSARHAQTMKIHKRKLADGHVRIITRDTPAPIKKELLALAKATGAVVKTESRGIYTRIYLRVSPKRDERLRERARVAAIMKKSFPFRWN